MRLVKTEIDKRLIVTLNKSITADGVNGVMKFGENNDYPQIIERLINGSVTSKSASNIYSKFLTGQGFTGEGINSIVIGEDNRGKPITMLSMLRQVSQSISFNNGFYIHTNVNVGREVVKTKLVPFKHCRFAKIDDKGYTAMIGIYDNWDMDKAVKFKKDDIVWINIFNLKEAVFNSQIEKAKGIQNYKGQVYFDFLDNQFLYPLSPFDPVYMDSDTEFQIQLFKNRQIRDGFFDKVVFRVSPPSEKREKEDFIAGIKNFIGPDADTVLVLEDEVDNDGNIKKSGAFVIDKIESNVNDKLFENWERGLANNIRKSVSNIPNLLIEIEDGIFSGQSGEAIKQATNFYNAMTQDDRAFISEAFKNIYSNFADSKLKSNKDWSIKSLNLTEDATTNIQSTTSD